MKTRHAFHAFVAVAATAIVLPTSSVGAADFKDKTIQLIIASDAGGGTDLVGRLMSQHMQPFLPGNPKIVIKNMGAGGGKIRGANLLMKAKGDGLTFMQSDTTVVQPSTLERKSARFDPKKFRMIGAINRGGSILFIRKAAMERLKDKSKPPVIVGAISGTRSWQAMPMWGAEFLGWNMKWIPGYKGSGQMTKALRQGEIDVFATNNVYIIEELRKDGVIELLTQEGQPEENGYSTRASYKDVPIFPVTLKAANPPKVAMQGYNSLMGPSQIDKWMGLPPGTPEDIVAAFRNAYDKAVKSKEFLAVANKQISKEIFYMSGKTVEKMVKEVHDVPPDALTYADKLKQKYGLAAAQKKKKK
ncbi:MAG: Bug family tripartite tricarboxylate transporter substrate binding protein [Alphaproteobacteria bacterium]